jgi:hypothetical protein
MSKNIRKELQREVKGRMQSEDVREQGAEENTWDIMKEKLTRELGQLDDECLLLLLFAYKPSRM